MKNKRKFSLITPVAILFFAILGCNMSTANLSSLTTSKDKAGKEVSSTFKSGETIYGTATISNNPDKVKVNLYLVVEDAKGLTKGETIKGSEVSVDLDGDGTANYSVPVTEALPPGDYKLIADMINEEGEKKDSKTTEVKIKKSVGSEKTVTDEPESDDEATDDSESQ